MNQDMHEWLGHAADEQGGTPAGLDVLGGRAKALKRRLFLRRAVVSVFALMIAFVAVTSARDLSFDERAQRGTATAGNRVPPLSAETLATEAVVTAVRALAATGLRDPLKIYFDYQRVVENSGVWTVSFTAIDCREDSCPELGGPNQVDVRLDGSEMEVVEARGAFSGEDRTSIVGYRDSVDAESGAGATVVVFAEDSEGVVAAWTSFLWLGPLAQDEEHNLGSKCLLELSDDGGVSHQQSFWSMAPIVEAARDGVGRLGLPTDFKASSASVSCGPATIRDFTKE